MATHTKTQFSKAKQSRSEKTLNDLVDAAGELVIAADPEKFTARTLAEKSGYALGTLTTRLKSVENVFIWVIEKQRDKHIQSVVKIIEDFDRDKSIEALALLLTEKMFMILLKVNPKVIQFIEGRLIKKVEFSSKYFHFMDPLGKALFNCSKTNLSNTFRVLTEKEAILMIRALIMVSERPFVEEDPIAGTIEHKRIVIESFVRLFGKVS